MASIESQQVFMGRYLHSLSWNDPERQSDCAICHESFDYTAYHPHEAVRITDIKGCNHVFGYKCVRSWIGSGGANCNTCPMCRTVWFEMAETSEPYVNGGPPRRILVPRRHRQDAAPPSQQPEGSSAAPNENAPHVSVPSQVANSSPGLAPASQTVSTPPLRGLCRPNAPPANNHESQIRTSGNQSTPQLQMTSWAAALRTREARLNDRERRLRQRETTLISLTEDLIKRGDDLSIREVEMRMRETDLNTRTEVMEKRHS